MAKSLYDLTTQEGVIELLQLDALSNRREVLSISVVLQEARELVRDAAVAKGIRIIVVGVADEVFVSRGHVVLVIAAMLQEAIEAAPPGGRVAVTGQEIERELVFAVYDDGSRNVTYHVDELAMESARVLGGRVWSAHPAEGHLNLFSVPLYRDAN
jgi:signal transduction histidine kinase